MFKIENWERIRGHRGTREWVKFSSALLDDFAFSMLPAESRALLPMLWVLAIDEDGVIDQDISSIAFVLRMSEQSLLSAIRPLIEAGFVTEEDMT